MTKLYLYIIYLWIHTWKCESCKIYIHFDSLYTIYIYNDEMKNTCHETKRNSFLFKVRTKNYNCFFLYFFSNIFTSSHIAYITTCMLNNIENTCGNYKSVWQNILWLNIICIYIILHHFSFYFFKITIFQSWQNR